MLFQLGLGGLAVLTYGELTNKIYMYHCFSVWMFAGFFVIVLHSNFEKPEVNLIVIYSWIIMWIIDYVKIFTYSEKNTKRVS